jgi:ribA/ribD-fused uncharacterized protein
MKTIMFYRTSEEYGCFSNFSSHSIILEGTKWRTVEHYFQAKKFLDGRLIFQIQMAESPLEAARLGRDEGKPLRSDWESIKEDVMRKAVEAKFRQNEDARNLLLSTGSAVIVEHTSNDCYWGDGGDGQGKNMLGKILMEVREKLFSEKDQKSEMLPPPWVKYPNEAPYSIGWSMGAPQSYMNEWSAWAKELSIEEQSSYVASYPEPDDWKGFYRGAFDAEAMEIWARQIGDRFR